MTFLASWRPTLAAALAFDRSKIDAGFTVRCAVGVAIPLVAATVAGNPAYGVAAASGALMSGFASMQGIYRSRAIAMVGTALGMALAAFAGELAESSLASVVLVTVLAGYAYGIVASLGPAASSVAVNSVVSLIVFGRLGLTPRDAAVQAALIFGGGLLQTLLLVGVWPFRRHGAERQTLAAAYRALATSARSLAAGDIALPAATTIASVQAALGDPYPFARATEVAAFQALLDQAERIRASFAALATDRARYRSLGARRADTAVREALDACAAPLDDIATSLLEGRAPRALGDEWLRVEEFERHLASDDHRAEPSVVREMSAVFGQIRAAWRIALAPADEPVASEPAHAPIRFRYPSAPEALVRMRANLSLRSPFGRHAVRLGIALAVASVAGHLLAGGRGYWIALTTLLVLRPDFATTFSRGFARLAGTLGGALIAAGVALALHPSPHLNAALALGFATLAYLVFNANYGLFSLCVTAYVVFLLAVIGQGDADAVHERLVATAIGAAIATATMLVWPTWESDQVAERLADLLDAQRHFAGLVLGAYVDPHAADLEAMHDAQLASWQARTAAEVSVQRAIAEPDRSRATSDATLTGLLAASRRFALDILALDARIAHAGDGPSRPELAPFRDALLATLETNARFVRATAPDVFPQTGRGDVAPRGLRGRVRALGRRRTGWHVLTKRRRRARRQREHDVGARRADARRARSHDGRERRGCGGCGDEDDVMDQTLANRSRRRRGLLEGGVRRRRRARGDAGRTLRLRHPRRRGADARSDARRADRGRLARDARLAPRRRDDAAHHAEPRGRRVLRERRRRSQDHGRELAARIAHGFARSPRSEATIPWKLRPAETSARARHAAFGERHHGVGRLAAGVGTRDRERAATARRRRRDLPVPPESRGRTRPASPSPRPPASTRPARRSCRRRATYRPASRRRPQAARGARQTPGALAESTATIAGATSSAAAAQSRGMRKRFGRPAGMAILTCAAMRCHENERRVRLASGFRGESWSLGRDDGAFGPEVLSGGRPAGIFEVRLVIDK